MFYLMLFLITFVLIVGLKAVAVGISFALVSTILKVAAMSMEASKKSD